MLNKEKYAKEIFDIACEGTRVAVADGKPRRCNLLRCSECDFCDARCDCSDKIEEWMNSKYTEYVDWNKIPVDTPILVRNGSKWRKRYFAKYENKTIYAYDNGRTSWSSDGKMSNWEYAKLV